MTHIAGSQIILDGNVDRQKRLTKKACRSEPLCSILGLRDLPEAAFKRKLNWIEWEPERYLLDGTLLKLGHLM